MKVLGISILIFVCLILFSLGIDMLIGFDVPTSIIDTFNPFLVMEVEEVVLFFLFIIYIVSISTLAIYRNRKKKKGTTKD